MATFTWKTGSSGDWATATNWTSGSFPNDPAADVVIDAVPVGAAYTVTIAANESETVNSIALNATNNASTVNQSPYLGAILEVDGTLTFAPTSAGLIDGPLLNYLIMNDGTIVNAGTVNAFVQGSGEFKSSATGTNSIYFTNDVQAQGVITIDQAIAEYRVADSTLFDGIWEAQGAGSAVNLGGADAGQFVNIATLEGPGILLPDGTNGWTQLIIDDTGADIFEYTSKGYVAVETTITTIQNNATITVGGVFDGVAHIRDYTTTNAFTIGNNALFSETGGTLTTGGLTIKNGGTLSGAPTVAGDVVNNGTILVAGGTMTLQGSVTGTGTMKFDAGGTLDVHGVGAGETVVLSGGDELIIEAPGTFKGVVSDTGGNTILLKGIIANSATVTNNTLNIFNNGSLVDAIALSSSVAGVAVTTTGGNTQLSLGAPSPVLTAGAKASYTTGGAPAILDAGLTISDPASTTLAGATVGIGAGFRAGDTLSVTAQPGITSAYNPATGLLTLAGTATLATYQTALESVAYTSATSNPTNGGTDTTRAINWSISDGTLTASGTSSLSLSFTAAAAGSTSSDILLQNNDGTLSLLQMNGSAVTANDQVGPNPGPTWFAMGTGDFYGNGDTDVLWQNTDGTVALWDLGGTTVLQGGAVGSNPGPTWHIKGTGDFYGDGRTDVLWQNDDGSVGLWELDGTTVLRGGLTDVNPGPAWHIAGTGDFYQDGHTDILWQNDNGSVGLWEMDGTTVLRGGMIDAAPGTDWHVKGTGDFYGDGSTDILWQHNDGSVIIWNMDGTTIGQSSLVGANPGSTWHITGTGDFNQDGKTDISWHSDDGTVATWIMDGSTILNGGAAVNQGTSSNVVGGQNMRFIYSTAANETLTASPITPDEFVMTNLAAGAHTIAGFAPTQDIVELSKTLFPTFTDLQARTSASAGGALIDLGNGSSLLLQGVSPNSLHTSNFALV